MRAIRIALVTALLLVAFPGQVGAHNSGYCGHGRDGWMHVTIVVGWVDASNGHFHREEHRWGPPPGTGKMHEDVWHRCPAH